MCQLQEDCTNGVDDDGDGLIDCKDGDCPPCPPVQKDPSRIKFDRAGGLADLLKVHGKFTPTTPVDPLTEDVGIVLTNSLAIIFRGTIPASNVTGIPGGKSFKFKDPTRTIADGVVKLQIKHLPRGDWTFNLTAYGNLRQATVPEMAFSFRIGDDSFVVDRRWQQLSNGWLLRDNQ